MSGMTLDQAGGILWQLTRIADAIQVLSVVLSVWACISVVKWMFGK
jgi:hypothetical protein